jgi:[ribosomal protein S5]-alanine N-acetyltransferase
MPDIDIRAFTSRGDYERVLDYFFGADEEFLRGMGVDPAKLSTRESWLDRLLPDLDRDDRDKQTCYLSWLHGGAPIGHCNLNKITYAHEAYLHLHMWDQTRRKAGLGTELVRRSLYRFFGKFALQRLYCEPYANNAAPNRVLIKLGFQLVRRYRTIPGIINFEQEVNQYVIEPEILV